MATNTVGLNQVFPIYNEDGTPFHGLVLRKGVVDSIVMSLGDKITGEVYYIDNTLNVTMKEYIEYNDVHYMLVNPPTIVREGMVADNSELKGTTKYSFEFYHPMCQLSNFPFTDVATKSGEEKYLSQDKTFSWIGNPQDYFDKLNKNLQGTVWYVRKSDRFPTEKNNELSEVQQFDKISIAEAIKRGYEIWGVPYIVSQLPQTDPLYSQGKRFVVEYGLPSNEIYESGSSTPFVFQMGKGVGLKNNSRTPRNNKIITRISGSGSESNIPYGYPQIIWYGNQDWDYTINNNPNDPNSYPIYKGIVGGQYVKLIKHPFTRTHLMPSIYTETVNKKVNPNAVGYNPNIEIKDYYDAIATQEYPYTNEINPQAPSYESHEFADIKPELDADRNTGIVSAVPLNADLTPADHWDDTMDDNGKYLQEYFKITLPQLDFDLYACASITEEMKINMRSGYCIGCTFTVQVDWDDYKKNFYDSDGNFLPDGKQRDLEKYPKSNLGQISVVVQKDNTTFGTLMPNIYQQPKANDLFVFIGISLPLSYITSAEASLDDAMKSYMLENNVFYFDYPLKFDEYFLATHTNILEQILPNSIIHFMFGGVEQQLFVKQLTIKYNNTPLPQYDITLTDNIEVVLNQIGQVVDDVEKLSSLLSVLRQSYNRNVWNELAKKLSKTQDDTASGYIRMLKGLQVGANFVPDILGEGGVLRMRSDGKVELVTDILYARMKAYFDTVEIREYRHTAGNRIASVAGNKCVRVAWFNSSGVEIEQTQANLSSVAYFRCFFRASDGDDTVRNNFSIGDQAYCHITSITTGSDNPEEKGLNQKHFWRLVIGRNTEGTLTEDGEAYIDLSNRAAETIGGVSYEGYQSGSDVPQPQDDIIQLGNVNDTTRQGAIVEYVTGTDAPSYQIYQGINSFSLNGRNQIGFGYDTGTGRAYMNVYGDFRFGSRNNNGSYIKYNSQTGNLEIKAHVEFTNSDSELDTLVQEHQRDDSYDDSWIQPAIDELQDQIDGAIETYYMVGQPALNLPPVISTQEHPYDEPWLDGTETQEERTRILNNHVGDLYYNKDTGHGYRFLYDDSSRSFVWVAIIDEDIEAALEAANNAQATADGKMTIYSIWGAWVKGSVNTLKVGDLFIPANDTTQGGVTYKARKVYKCTTDGQNSFVEINYTDDSTVRQFIDVTFPSEKQGLQNQIDGKIESWFSTNDPASSWTDDDTKAKHVGDMWYNSSTHLLKRYTLNGSTYSWETVEDQKAIDAYNNAATAQYTADGKRTVFTTQPTPPYMVGDLWAQGTSGDIMRCTNARTDGSYVASDWEKASKYTDDSALNAFRLDQFVQQLTNGTITTNITSAQNAAKAAQQAADAAQADADAAAAAAAAAQTSATNANSRLNGWADDGKISPTEKTSLKLEWENVKKEYTQICNDADKYSVSKTAFASAYTSANSAFQKYTAATPENITIDADYANIAAYYAARQTILDAITTAAKKVATDAQTRADSAYALADSANTAAQTADAKAAALGYLSQALGQDTTIAGGLVLSTLIGLRDGNGRIWSGINGAYQTAETGTGYKGHGIAAWYGGAMVDKEVVTTATDYAKSLFRFDGSGYLASGNISWDASGNATYKGNIISKGSLNSRWEIVPELSGDGTIAIPRIIGYSTDGKKRMQLIFDADDFDIVQVAYGGGLSFFEQEAGVGDVIAAGYFKTTWITSNSDDYNSSSIRATSYPSEPRIEFQSTVNSGKYLTVGVDTSGVLLSSTNWPTLTSISSNGRAYVDTQYGILRVKGYNDSSLPWGGGGGGTVTRITAGTGLSGGTITGSGTISIDSTYQTWISDGHTAYGWGDHRQAGYLTSVAFSNLTSHPTSISGYGITDAYISGGTIHLGSNSITPLSNDMGENYLRFTNSAYLKYTLNDRDSVLDIACQDNIHIDSDSNVTIEADFDINIESGYRANITGGDTINITSSTGGIYLNAPLGFYMGTSARNAIVNIADSAQIVQTNHSYQPYLLFHKPNVNWTRLVMADDGTIEVRAGETGTAFNKFACGRITVDRGSYGYGVINIDADGINIDGSHTDADQVYLLASHVYCGGDTKIDGNCEAESFIQSSDVNRKNIISDLNLNIYNIANAPIFKFTWKDGKDNQALHVGTAAQYWQTVLPETVLEKKDGMLAMQYDVVALAAAVITAKTVVSHEERIKVLENENKVLREEIELLKNQVN